MFAVDIKVVDTVDQLIKHYPEVFGPGIGQLDGKYHIQVDDSYHLIVTDCTLQESFSGNTRVVKRNIDSAD